MQHYRELTFEESLPVANDESKERNDSGRKAQEVKFLPYFSISELTFFQVACIMTLFADSYWRLSFQAPMKASDNHGTVWATPGLGFYVTPVPSANPEQRKGDRENERERTCDTAEGSWTTEKKCESAEGRVWPKPVEESKKIRRRSVSLGDVCTSAGEEHSQSSRISLADVSDNVLWHSPSPRPEPYTKKFVEFSSSPNSIEESE